MNSDRALRPPDRLLVVTIGAQWAVTIAVALAASRTGSLFGEIAVADAWIDHGNSVAHGSLAPTGGPLYALLLAPVTLLTTRPSTVASIVTVVNVIILAPLATYCLLDVGRRIAGRPFAIVAAAARSPAAKAARSAPATARSASIAAASESAIARNAGPIVSP